MRVLSVALLATIVSSSLLAQETGMRSLDRPTLEALPAPQNGTDCPNPPHDGGFEDGLGWDPSQVEFGEYAQRFDVGGPATLQQVCLHLTRLAASPLDNLFDIAVFDDNGSGGSPGTLITVLGPFQKPDIAVFPATTLCVVAAGGIPTDGSVYISTGWDTLFSPDLFISTDESNFTAPQTIYGRSQETLGSPGPWNVVTEAQGFEGIRSLGVNADFDPALGYPPCTPNPTTLCLNNNRFKVEVDWRTATNQAPADVVPFGSDDSGLFYFFDPNNWEMLIKALDACQTEFNSFWVFYAATTNVEFTVTVTDTETAKTQQYFNPLGNPAPPIQDTSAFATCP